MQTVIITSSYMKPGARALQEESMVQQLQQIGDQEKLKYRMASKALIRCTHFLARCDNPHTTNFDELIDLVVSCGAEDLKRFLKRAGKNVSYISKVAVTVVEFVEAVGLQDEQCLLNVFIKHLLSTYIL